MDIATLELAFARQVASAAGASQPAPVTALVTRRHSGPLRVQKALYPEGASICHAVIVHPPGGIVGGDELNISANLGVAAHAFLTTPGATKWYRAEAGARSAQHTRLQVAADACCEWLPQESIYFDGVNASTELDVRLGAGARFIGQEITCLGRRASGERFLRGSLAQRVRVSVAERPVFVEQGRLSAASGLMQAEIGLNGCSVAATLLAVGALGKAGQAVVQACRAALAEATGAELATSSATNFATLGATRLGVTRMTPQACPGTDVLVVRYLGQSSEEARRALLLCWQVIRPALLGVAAATPRIWNT